MGRLVGRTPRSMGQVVWGLAGDGVAIVVVGLVVLGVAGLVYKLLAPEGGWVSGWLGQLWNRSPGLVWVAGFLGAIAVILVKHAYDRRPRGQSGGNFVVYAFVGLGLFFFFKLIVTGSL